MARLFSKAPLKQRQQQQWERAVQEDSAQDGWFTGEEYRRFVDDPSAAWRQLVARYPEKTVVRDVTPKPYDSPKPPQCVRFVCISDTHNQIRRPPHIPDGDVLIHAGDFTLEGYGYEVESFVDFLQTLPHKHKVSVYIIVVYVVDTH